MKQLASWIPHGVSALSDDYLSWLNLRRAALTALLTLAFLIGYAFDSTRPKSTLLTVAACIMAGLAVGYLVLIWVVIRRGKTRASILRAIYLTYWLQFVLCMSPFVIAEMITRGTVFDLLLLFAALLVAPVLSPRVVCAFFTISIAFLLALTLLARIKPVLCLAVVSLGAAAFLLAYTLHRDYARMVTLLRRDSNTDYLTGVANKRAGLAEMEAMLAFCARHGKSCVVYIVDIDHFKGFNDTYGHIEGDAALTRVASAIRQTFTRGSDIVSRIGGEEFCVMASIETGEAVALMARQLLLHVRALGLRTGDARVADELTVSVGAARLTFEARPVATIDILAACDRAGLLGAEAAACGSHFEETQPPDGLPTGTPPSPAREALTELLRRADAQLYAAKEHGRNVCCYRGTFYAAAPAEPPADA